METITLVNHLGASVEISRYGATLPSYKNSVGKENLFVSSNAILDGSKAIRGGVPIVFPQFGRPHQTMPSHGFARISQWDLVSQEPTEVTLELRDSEKTFQMWPYHFHLLYTVRLFDEEIETSLRVLNTGNEVFNFQALLHTYYWVPSIESVSLHGFGGVSSLDQLNNMERSVGEETVLITSETDRIYQSCFGPNVERRLIISVNNQPFMEIESGAWIKQDNAFLHDQIDSDVVCWNPWIEKSKRLDDFGDDEFHQMICIEPGVVVSPIQLQPNQEFMICQSIRPRG